MSSRALKISTSILVLTGGLGYLMYSSMADNIEYYKYVDEIADEKERWAGVRLRLAGSVEEGSIFHRPGTHEYLFSILHEDAAIEVRYTGTVPDSFAEGAEVVVSGKLHSDGHFEARRVFARCPSKYEPLGPPPHDHAGRTDDITARDLPARHPVPGSRGSPGRDTAEEPGLPGADQ